MLSAIILGGVKLLYTLLIDLVLSGGGSDLTGYLVQYEVAATAGGFFLLYAIILLFFLRQQKGVRNGADDLLERICDALEEFTPSQMHDGEEDYRGELYQYLTANFPDVEMTVQNERGKPSFILRDVGIEIRGPADNGTLDSIATLCMQSSAGLRCLIVVLCEPHYAPDHFHDVERGMKQYFRNVRILQK
ncbi:MAG: hypothetical protein QMC96_11315 [Methanomicrobiales archaeon]|nr:hypothetical protein [Methanomicrobiales archaeon]